MGSGPLGVSIGAIWGFWTTAGFSTSFVPLRIATVAPVMNPTRKAMTTNRITVSFFISISFLFLMITWNRNNEKGLLYPLIFGVFYDT
jgi:hypothetical protein